MRATFLFRIFAAWERAVEGPRRGGEWAVVDHDARTGNTASEVGVIKEVCGAVYGGPYLSTDRCGVLWIGDGPGWGPDDPKTSVMR